MAQSEDTDNLLLRLLRLEARFEEFQGFIEDGIADPWDELERRLGLIEERLAAVEARLASLQARR